MSFTFISIVSATSYTLYMSFKGMQCTTGSKRYIEVFLYNPLTDIAYQRGKQLKRFDIYISLGISLLHINHLLRLYYCQMPTLYNFPPFNISLFLLI